MKTVTEIESEINTLICNITDNNLTVYQTKKMRKEIEALRIVKLYVETLPEQAALEKQLEELLKKENLIHSNFNAWYASNPEYKTKNNVRKFYYTTMNLAKVQEQIHTLKYILKVA